MEEYKTCKICLNDKPLNEFVKNKYAKTSGFLNICKICRKLKLTIDKSFKDPTSTKNTLIIYRPTQEDYASMYELLKRVGYDVDNGDVHQQFINRWNDRLEEPMLPKKRSINSLNHYFPNGDKNPNAKKSHNK